MSNQKSILAMTSVAGLTAAAIREVLGARPSAKSKAHVAGLVKARLDRDIAAGKIPKRPSLALFAELSGAEYEWDRGNQRTHKQIRKGTATLNERKAAKPEAKPRKQAKAKAKAKPSGLSIESLVAEHGADEVLAAFTKFLAQAK